MGRNCLKYCLGIRDQEGQSHNCREATTTLPEVKSFAVPVSADYGCCGLEGLNHSHHNNQDHQHCGDFINRPVEVF